MTSKLDDIADALAELDIPDSLEDDKQACMGALRPVIDGLLRQGRPAGAIIAACAVVSIEALGKLRSH